MAANLFGILEQLIDWRLIILGVAVFVAAVLAVGFFTLSLPPNKDTRDFNAPREKNQPMFQMSIGLWLLALIWSLANAQLLAYITFGPQFFQSVGMSIQKAGLFTSFIMLVPIFLSPLIGIIIDKTGWKKQLILIGSIIIAVSFILISITFFNLAPWAFLLGIGFTPIPVVVFSLLPELVKPHQVGAGLGVLTAASNLGITIGPAAFGLLLDLTAGSFFIGFILLALVSGGIILSSPGVRTIKQ